MPLPKRNKSTAIVNHDGRKKNGRKKGDVVKQRQAKMTVAKMNKAKRGREKVYAINAIREAYSSEEEFWLHVATQSKKSFSHMKLLMEYGYGSPKDGTDAPPPKSQPTINFYGSQPPQVEQDNAIDVTHEDVTHEEE